MNNSPTTSKNDKPQQNKQSANHQESSKTPKLKKVLTVANIQNQSIDRIPFKGDWFQAFKKPQNKGVWFIWGGSGSGKSTFQMMLAKEFAKTEKVFYNLLEEEMDDSDFVERTELCRMNEVADNFNVQRYNYDELYAYLEKRGSPKVVVIDSITYFTKDFSKYMHLKKKFPDKIFIISGHAEGKNPRTKLEEDIMYDAKMKIFVSGYLATCKGRTIGPNGGLFVIWPEGYKKLQGASLN